MAKTRKSYPDTLKAITIEAKREIKEDTQYIILIVKDTGIGIEGI